MELCFVNDYNGFKKAVQNLFGTARQIVYTANPLAIRCVGIGANKSVITLATGDGGSALPSTFLADFPKAVQVDSMEDL